jgi:carboxylesterase
MPRTFLLVNPHLPGAAFFWQGGPVGVLLVHGFTATPAEIHLLGQYLHARGFTVAGPLLPGHGTTPQDANRTRWQAWVEAVEVSYRQLVARCDTVFLGGESTGGLLALYLAAEHPQAAGILTYAPALITAPAYGPFLLPLLAPFIPYLAKPKSNHPPTPADERWQGYPVNPPAAPDRPRSAGWGGASQCAGSGVRHGKVHPEGGALDAQFAPLRAAGQ